METPIYQLRLDHRNGNLIGLTWKKPSLEVIAEPRLGENFRILLPRADYEANYFCSSEQQVSRIEKTSEGVTCVYENLRNGRETLNVKVRYHMRAIGDRLEFAIEIDNPTDLPLAEVYFAVIGGQQGLVNRQDTESLVTGSNVNLASRQPSPPLILGRSARCRSGHSLRRGGIRVPRSNVHGVDGVFQSPGRRRTLLRQS